VRYLVALVILLAGTAAGLLAYQHLTAGPSVDLPVPARLELAANGASLGPGVWMNSSSVMLSAHPSGALIAGADFEVRPAGERFSGTPTATFSNTRQVALNCRPNTSCASPSPGVPAVHVQLRNGVYHWQVRLHNKDGISPWRVYPGVIRVDTQPPAPPLVSSPTDPNPARTYHSSTLRFGWQGEDDLSGVAGYSYRLDTSATAQPPPTMRTVAGSVTLAGLDTGAYYFHIRALDRAGNWGRAATFPVRIDVTPPGLTHVRFNEFQFNPEFSPLHVTFGVSRPASTVRVGVYRQKDGAAVRLFQLGKLSKGQKASIWWNGKDAIGQTAGPGTYKVYIRAIDRWGHSSLTGWSDFAVNYRRIVVSLGQQRLFAYDGDRVVRQTLVTTGNRALPTPKGTYAVMGHFHPFTFHSPWPKSSPFYYPPSKVAYALLFREGGYFIHDAPWRSAFGPGTNAAVGTPGQNFTGTHGCVNTPPDMAAWLYQWAPDGTVVQVVN